MSKRFNRLNGEQFAAMVRRGADCLRLNEANVNALNVFPVPDGDTGSNMSRSWTSGDAELRSKPSERIGPAAETLSKGLLMGARGNSGVILSQLFRGFARSVRDEREIDARQFAAALQQGVDTAYQAVVKPVEGTILSVAREAARHALTLAMRESDIAALMREVLAKAKEALARTPEQLPVLRQVGVVDAGGQGLVCIYEGFVAALEEGAKAPADSESYRASAAADRSASPARESRPVHAQAHLATEDIEFGYCTEFMIRLRSGETPGDRFDETRFRGELQRHGDSVLVVADDELVKVHLHAEYPGEVLTYAQRYGELTSIKIENMREQHSRILQEEISDERSPAEPAKASGERSAGTPEASVSAEAASKERKPYGFVAVASGDGISDILRSLGADVVLSGGQTMNPSTEDIAVAIGQVQAETVFVLPNNSNIVLAAQQARDLLDRRVVVVPTKTIPQGMAALIAFRPDADAERNAALMEEAIGRVRSGQVTYAVRDSQMDDLSIRAGDYLGIRDGKIVVSAPDLTDACRTLIDSMMAEGGDVVTILTGEEAPDDVTEHLAEYVGKTYPDAELEVHPGGQPLYYYLISVE